MISKTVLVLLVTCAALAAGNPAVGQEWKWKTRTPTVDVIEGARPPPQQPSERIVGGSEATPHSYPHQVALYIDDTYFCGGSIISPEWVMTAAHCMDGAASVEVVAGAHNLQVAEPTQVTMTSLDFTVHENYGPVLLQNDISVIRLPTPLTFTTEIQSVNLPTAGANLAEGTSVNPSGWGKTSDGIGGISDTLNQVTVPINSHSECGEYYGTNIVTDGVLCTDSTGGHGTCSGDSGGPLNYQGATYGVTSFVASAGCESGYPHGFTNVIYFLDWIAANTGVTSKA